MPQGLWVRVPPDALLTLNTNDMCFNVVDTAVQTKFNVSCWKIMIFQFDGKLNSYLFPSKTGYSLGETIIGTGATHGHQRRHAKSLNKRPKLSSEVVHSFDTYQAARVAGFWYLAAGYHLCIVKCTIPKGTWYWHNPREHEYASFQVRLDEIVKDYVYYGIDI